MKQKLIILLILSLTLVGSVNAATPPNPTLLTSDTSQSGHVLWSWVAGTIPDVITDSYNVSIDSVWYNGSSSTSYNDNVGSGKTSTITVWAYNSTSVAALSTGNVTGSQKGVFTLSSITDVIEGIIPLFASIIDLVVAIVPLTIVMAIVAGLAILINKALSKAFK